MVKEIDEDGNGEIDYDEFKNMMLNLLQGHDWATMILKIIDLGVSH